MYGQASFGLATNRDPLARLRQNLQTVRPDADFLLLRRAYEVAAECHQGQFRKSGDPYISHPVMVATILAGLGADDQTLCAAILHDTVEDTPFTMTALRRRFSGEVATLVAEVMKLDHLGARRRTTVAEALARIGSADRRVATVKLADRLHNMQTIEFLRPSKQRRKARESLDVFAPAAEELCVPGVGTELERLAFVTLRRSQPARQPIQRTIVALDIERSTSRSDPVKRQLRIMLYELFDAALRSADIYLEDRDQFEDRGDGLLAIIHPAEQTLVSRAAPKLARLLTSYNAGVGPQHQLRVRMVVHAGEVNYDGHGCFGAALDTAFRLLDAPEGKRALARARGPLLLVVSDDVGGGPGRGRVSVDVGGHRRRGWLSLP
jgi:HD domain-containing protein